MTASAPAGARITRGHRIFSARRSGDDLPARHPGRHRLLFDRIRHGLSRLAGLLTGIIPPPQINSIIEYTHRFVALLTSPLIIAAAVVSWRRRFLRWVSRPLAVALVFLVVVIIFGALTVLTGLPPVLAAIDLGSALLVLALVVTAATVAWRRHGSPGLPDRLALRTPLAAEQRDSARFTLCT